MRRFVSLGLWCTLSQRTLEGSKIRLGVLWVQSSIVWRMMFTIGMRLSGTSPLPLERRDEQAVCERITETQDARGVKILHARETNVQSGA